MVKTRSNRDTADVGPLPFDPSDISRIEKPEKRPLLAFNYCADLVQKTLDSRLVKFLLTKTALDDNAEHEWVPVRALGVGNHVRVGLWKKLDKIGNDIDRVVIKEDKLNYRRDALYDVGLPHEAVMQGHLTAMKNGRPNITQLRAYKFLPNPSSGGPELDRCRLYQRFAPHGTLQDVWWRYRAFRTYLPELYLWSVLVDLAKANDLLRKCPATWNPISRLGHIPRDMEQDPDSFLLHQDMKPLKCFIGGTDSKPNSRRPYHPTELGDFGATQVRKLDSSAKLFFHFGTDYFFAPEQCSYGENWQHKIYNFGPGAFGITEMTNAWGAGCIMWHLMTLKSLGEFPAAWQWREPWDATREVVRPLDLNAEVIFHHVYNRHFMPYTAMNSDHSAGQYSKELKDLVYQCLRPDFTERPTAAELLYRAQQGYKVCRSKVPHTERPPSVHFSNAAMNDHVPPLGDAAVEFSPDNPMDQAIYDRLILQTRICMGDPEDAPLKPRAGWHEFHVGAPIPPQDGIYEDDYPHGLQPLLQYGRLLADDFRQGKLTGRKDVPSYLMGDQKIPKRIRSWDPQEEDELEMRHLLRQLRIRTQYYASGKPIRLLTYILECEKYDVAATERVLEWLYRPGNIEGDFPWAQKPAVRQQAAAAKRKWQARFGVRRPRTLRECIYFVVQESPGVTRIDMAIKRMDYIFRPEDVDDAPFSPIRIQLPETDENQRLLEARMHMLDAFERGVSPYPLIPERRVIVVLRENNGDVQASVAQLTQELQLGQHLPQRIPSQESHFHPANEPDDDTSGAGAQVPRRMPGAQFPGRGQQQNGAHDLNAGDDPRGRHQPVAKERAHLGAQAPAVPLNSSEFPQIELHGPPIPPFIPPPRRFPPPEDAGSPHEQHPAGQYVPGAPRYPSSALRPPPWGSQHIPNGSAAPSSDDDVTPQIVEVDGAQQAVLPNQQHAMDGQGGYNDLHDTGMAQDGEDGEDWFPPGADEDLPGEDQDLASEEAKSEVASMPDGEDSKLENLNPEDDDVMPSPTSSEKEHATAWKVQHEQETKDVKRNLRSHAQRENRLWLSQTMRSKLTAQRRSSLPAFGIGDRWDVDFGEIGEAEQERGSEEPMFMSGGLGLGDTLHMERDPEFQRQLKEDNEANVVDHETGRLQKQKEKKRKSKH